MGEGVGRIRGHRCADFRHVRRYAFLRPARGAVSGTQGSSLTVHDVVVHVHGHPRWLRGRTVVQGLQRDRMEDDYPLDRVSLPWFLLHRVLCFEPLHLGGEVLGSGALHEMFAILALWFGVSVPLVFLGAYFGFRK